MHRKPPLACQPISFDISSAIVIRLIWETWGLKLDLKDILILLKGEQKASCPEYKADYVKLLEKTYRWVEFGRAP